VGVGGYRIVRGGTVVDRVMGNQTSYEDATVEPSTGYSDVVHAFDAAGNRRTPMRSR
jgi:hypothetical protein